MVNARATLYVDVEWQTETDGQNEEPTPGVIFAPIIIGAKMI